jgi:hypothetical protein
MFKKGKSLESMIVSNCVFFFKSVRVRFVVVEAIELLVSESLQPEPEPLRLGKKDSGRCGTGP